MKERDSWKAVTGGGEREREIKINFYICFIYVLHIFYICCEKQ